MRVAQGAHHGADAVESQVDRLDFVPADGEERERLLVIQLYFSGKEEVQGMDQVSAHLTPVDDGVEHSVLEQELRALKTLRELLPDRLLDDARPGEADQSAGFG